MKTIYLKLMSCVGALALVSLAAPSALAQCDNALVVWHSDGTEIMNSARPPQDGNFCLGVWKHDGENRYYINHFPWRPNDTTGGVAGIGVPQDGIQLTEQIVLSPDGKSYSGTFTLKQYDANGILTVTITGTIAAKRITTETQFSDLL